MKSYDKARKYAKQRGVTDLSGPGGGFKVTPKQRRRLERTHIIDMRKIMRGAH